ncbi:MAG: hypothetical protein U1G07_07470 [Verrucomicrobiota bacterium]
MSIEVVLLGQYHDRRIRLYYDHVTRYQLLGQSDRGRTVETVHGDVLTHEVRAGDTDQVIHEIAFVTGSTFYVECETFTVAEEVFPATHGEPATQPTRGE